MEHNIGHRERAREKLLKTDLGTLEDYEILELLLFWSIPRKDTKQLAKTLIQKYGSLAKVISASTDSISKIEGFSNSTLASLKLVREAAFRLTKEDITKKTCNFFLAKPY